MTPIMAVMPFPNLLCQLRKTRRLTQVEAADLIGVSLPQYQRYEGGKSQPTLDVIRNIALAFNVSADALIFEPNERAPDDDLRLQFEAISQFDDDEREMTLILLESLILRHEAKNLSIRPRRRRQEPAA